jgi:hypothetical protein
MSVVTDTDDLMVNWSQADVTRKCDCGGQLFRAIQKKDFRPVLVCRSCGTRHPLANESRIP